MKDEHIEQLSRLVDGDLSPAEERDLRARLELDPALASDLAALNGVRQSLAVLASSEKAPVDLDSLVEPLLRGRPEAIVVRPWVRWLAAAAILGVGLTVVTKIYIGHPAAGVENKLARRSIQPTVEPAERFALAPLPTNSVPPEKQLIGVGEVLLASPIPDVDLGNPPALDVLGPLEEEVGEELSPPSDTLLDSKGRRKAEVAGVSADRSDESRVRDAAPAPRPASETTATGKIAKPEDLSTRGATSSGSRLWRDHTTAGRGQLFVFVDEETAWQDFETKAFCTPGRYAVRVKVSAGVVTEVLSIGGASADKTSQRLCAGQLVVGLAVTGVPDGEHSAEVVVEPRGVGR
jgi:hypothetical protein